MRFTPFIAAPFAALLAAQPAHAGSHSWRVGADSYHVYHTGLDLQTSAGRTALLARLERAAGKLCQGGVRRQQLACVREAVSRAASQPSAAALRVALHERDTVQVASR